MTTKKQKAKTDMFRAGNHKLHRSVGVFSLPPIKTCVNCKDCASTCYAQQQYIQYKQTKVAWDRNLDITKTSNFIKIADEELQIKNKKIVRIHNSGDFYDETYINKWSQIIKDNPNTMFYGYTKNKKALILNDLPNCNMIYSFINGYRNYGTIDYCNLLKEKFGAYVCKLEVSDTEKCMKTCNKCLSCDKVAIVIHGNKRKKDVYEKAVMQELERV